MGLWVLANQPSGLKAIDLGHDHVHQDEIWQLGNSHIHGLLPVQGGNDFVPRLENQLQDLVHKRVVFRNEDFLFIWNIVCRYLIAKGGPGHNHLNCNVFLKRWVFAVFRLSQSILKIIHLALEARSQT